MITVDFLAFYNLTNKTVTIQNNYHFVYVYYSNLEYTLISELIKTTASDLVSNLGGTLGLYVGVSFLSLAEFFELIVNGFFN